MTVAFVHGNPETAAIWNDLFAALDRDDLVALSPPGFGAPVPANFDATRLSYLDWLATELEALNSQHGPIDLVGHDWGAGHVMGIALTRPDLIRSWCIDLIGLFHADYVWHDQAQVWLTEGAGEENVDAMMTVPPADLAAVYESLGMSPTAAIDVAGGAGADMGRCILALYRSAPEAELQRLGADIEAAAKRPGLAIIAEHDHYVGSPENAKEMAARAGASVAELSGVGHWWMMQDPTSAAAALASFWSGLE